MESILIYSSLLLIVTYIVAVSIKQKGIPYSVSATYYPLEHKFIFALAMIGTGMLLMPVIINKTPENIQSIAFMSCAGIIIVGISPNFREDFEGKIHQSGALMCIVGSQIWTFIMSPYSLLIWPCYLIYTVIMKLIYKYRGLTLKESFMRTRPLFWVELSAIISIYVSLIIIL